MDTLSPEAGEQTVDEWKEIPRRQRTGIPSRPLFGRLPLARKIPQDLHSVLDYASATTLLLAGMIADSRAARTTGIVLGAADAATSFMTDYRLSGPKLVPIEVHEALDYMAGIGAMLAPLWFGKRKGDRAAAIMHVLVGAGTIVVSLFTDYRAQRGRTWPRVQRALGAGPA
jgi:hypothetical protein